MLRYCWSPNKLQIDKAGEKVLVYYNYQGTKMTTTIFLNTIQKVSATLFHPNVNEEQQERAIKKEERGAGG